MMKKFRFKKPGNRFGAKATVVDGMRFDSKKEANYYGQLKLAQKAGQVDFFLRQVPFHLPGNTKYVVDFMVAYADGAISFIDTKGVETETFKLKKRQVEDLYSVEIEIV